MAKYINADLLRKEIEKERKSIDGLFTEGDNSFYDGQDDAYNHTLALIESLQQEQPKESLEEAAEEYASDYPAYNDEQAIAKYAFKRGAEWQKAQMMKDAVEGEVVLNPYPTICLDDCKDYGFKDGDKVRIIIVKEEN